MERIRVSPLLSGPVEVLDLWGVHVPDLVLIGKTVGYMSIDEMLLYPIGGNREWAFSGLNLGSPNQRYVRCTVPDRPSTGARIDTCMQSQR